MSRVAVCGAGPSLEQFKPDDYDMVIGVNYVYKLVPVDYLVVTHFMLLLDIFKGVEKLPEGTTLVYSEFASDWVFMGSANPPCEGIMFREYLDLCCGTSTIIPAIDLATRMSNEIHLYGVDLCQPGGIQYANGYQTTKTQEPDFFEDWARLVSRQIAGLQWRSGAYMRFFR